MSDNVVRFTQFLARTPEGEEKLVSLNARAVVSVEDAPVDTPDFWDEAAGPKTIVRTADGRVYVLAYSMAEVFDLCGYAWR